MNHETKVNLALGLALAALLVALCAWAFPSIRYIPVAWPTPPPSTGAPSPTPTQNTSPIGQKFAVAHVASPGAWCFGGIVYRWDNVTATYHYVPDAARPWHWLAAGTQLQVIAAQAGFY